MDPGGAIFCRRCGTELTPGQGDFYVVRLEAFADPFPPVISDEDFEKDHRETMRELTEQMSGLSPREAMDSVHRRMSFFLCAACYRPWIEEPTGS